MARRAVPGQMYDCGEAGVGALVKVCKYVAVRGVLRTSSNEASFVSADFSENVHHGLVIRVMERRDIEEARKLHNDDQTLLHLTDVFHVSEAEQERWYDNLLLSRTSKRYSILEADSGKFVGLFRLDSIDLQNRSAWVGLDIARPFRGRGYAKIVYDYFFDYLFRQMGLNRLALVTLETNTVAVSLYESLGFRQEGRPRQAIWRGGKYIDLLQYSLLREEYEARPPVLG